MQLTPLRVRSPQSPPQQRPAGAGRTHASGARHSPLQCHPSGCTPTHASPASLRHHSIPLVQRSRQDRVEASRPLQEPHPSAAALAEDPCSSGSTSNGSGGGISSGKATCSSGSAVSHGVAVSRRHAHYAAAALISLLGQLSPGWGGEAAAAAGGGRGTSERSQEDASLSDCENGYGMRGRPGSSSTSGDDGLFVRIALERDDGVLCMSFTLDGRSFRGVLDTGGPFLTVGASFVTAGAPAGAGMTAVGGDGGGGGGSNGSCAYWGCWQGEGRPSGLEDTFEMFASQDGRVQWRRGNVQLLDVRLGMPKAGLGSALLGKGTALASSSSSSSSSFGQADASEDLVVLGIAGNPAVDSPAYKNILFGGSGRPVCSHEGSTLVSGAIGAANIINSGSGRSNNESNGSSSGSLSGSGNGDIIFGVFRSLVMKGGAGDQSLVGLVRNTAPGIRPSLLGQTPYRCFELDFAAGTLTLDARSPSPLLPPGADWAPLVDLRRLGAPSQQYIVLLSAVYINGRRLTALRPDGMPAPLYGMLDSGSTGLYISERLFYSLQREAGGWRSCDVEFRTVSGRTQRLSAARPDPQFLAFATDFPWLEEEEGYMFVLGMAFLEGTSMVVDMEDSRLLLRPSPPFF